MLGTSMHSLLRCMEGYVSNQFQPCSPMILAALASKVRLQCIS